MKGPPVDRKRPSTSEAECFAEEQTLEHSNYDIATAPKKRETGLGVHYPGTTPWHATTLGI